MLIQIMNVVFLAVAFLVEIILTETEHFGWSTVMLLVIGGICYFFNLYDLALWVKAHVLYTILFVTAYLVVGVIWSFIKWTHYLYQYRDKWREAKEQDKKELPNLIRQYTREFENNKHAPMSIPQSEKEWEKWIKENYIYRLKGYNFKILQASEHKSKIVAWMCFWIFSCLGTFVNDPIRRFFSFLFSSFKDLYQKLSDHVFKNETYL